MTSLQSEGQWGEGKTDDMVEDGDMEGGGEESLLPFLCTTTSTPTSPPTTSNTPPPPYTTTAPLINQASLMQHLRWGGERRGADQSQGGEGGGVPVDICLVTSTTNTQVTITPAGHHLTQDMRPPKIAKELPHKPSVAEIKAQYPGVTVLGDIDFSRLPFLMMEMQEFMSDRHERAMEAAGITAEVLQRLEVEAQLLREAEPFYLEDYPARSDREDKNDLSVAPSPTVLQKLNAEIEEMCEGSKDSDTHPHVSPLSPKVKGENEDRKRGENGHDGGQRNTDSPPLSPPRKRVKIETETQSTSNPEKCAGTSGSKRENVDSPLHSPSRKRRKIGTETQVKSPPEKCGGTSVSTISSAAQDALQHAPPKQLIERLLREARMLTEG
ncbi:hypothetical protein GWK47_041412 [Chionoecetes opilio]|uniref:Uncharacterized protein n=1 Tax=Chionoecetes opilio TaxID=41210 RepID=A0A8J4YP16_CHIOP|nr:hypothetical protein GWK47_041412 [Chionoecetes opilio]